MSKIPYQLGFEHVSWDFLKTSHGKGPADGVGAAVKAMADRLVLYGTDITNSDELLDALEKQLNVKMFKIDPDRIDFFKRGRDRKKNTWHSPMQRNASSSGSKLRHCHAQSAFLLL